MGIIDFKVSFEEGYCVLEARLQGEEDAIINNGDNSVRAKSKLSGITSLDISKATYLIEALQRTIDSLKIDENKKIEEFINSRGCPSARKVEEYEGDKIMTNSGEQCGKCIYCKMKKANEI